MHLLQTPADPLAPATATWGAWLLNTLPIEDVAIVSARSQLPYRNRGLGISLPWMHITSGAIALRADGSSQRPASDRQQLSHAAPRGSRRILPPAAQQASRRLGQRRRRQLDRDIVAVQHRRPLAVGLLEAVRVVKPSEQDLPSCAPARP